jgi:hypothetical protein
MLLATPEKIASTLGEWFWIGTPFRSPSSKHVNVFTLLTGKFENKCGLFSDGLPRDQDSNLSSPVI